MKVECTVNEDEVAAAWLLSQKPRREIARLGIFFGVFGLIGIAFGVRGAIRGTSSSIPLVILVAALSLCLVGLFWYLPQQVRRGYRNLEGGFLPFSIEPANDGLHFESEPGSLVLSWEDIPMWREGRSMFLIYRSEDSYHIVPKRCFESARAVDAFRDGLIRSRGPAT